MADKDDTTHFGFARVPMGDKAARVAGVFHAVAGRYDVMNDLMSLGTHRLMKQMTANATRARAGHLVLDLAGGTGDVAALLAAQVGAGGGVCICDINGSMLNRGRDRLLDRGLVGNVSFVQADGEQLPFADDTFNAVTIAFGLRNFTNQEAALQAVFGALKPGGRLVVLEFSRPDNPLLKNAWREVTGLWPKLGRLVTGDESGYRYLAESIQMHPDQQTLCTMMEQAGYARVRYHNLLGGVTAIHEGVKPRGEARP